MTCRQTKLALRVLAACFALALATPAVGASNDKGFSVDGDVRMIVPFAAGGGSDMAGRAIANGLEKVTDATIKVVNIVGGSGAVGYAELLSAQGDPRVLLASETSLISLPLVQDVPFTFESFTPIMKLGAAYNIVIADSDASYETCKDVVDAAKNGRFTVAVSGVTSPDAVAWTLIEDQFGIKFQRVPFQSTAAVIAAVMGDQVDVAAASPGEVIGQLKSGDIKGLCVLAPKRYEYPALADIPTGQEQGINATFAQWRGFIAAGDLSQAERQFWIQQAKEFAETEVFNEYLKKTKLQRDVAYGDEFAQYLENYRDTLKKIFSNAKG